jgi:hypothetical protein
LTGPAWQDVGSSSTPFRKLRFGDFTGDGVTDVLGLNGGRWAISDAARGSWRQLNASLGEDVSSLMIADLDNNNIDDLLKLRVSARSLWPSPGLRLSYKWYVSDDGRTPWRELKSYVWDHLGFEPVLSGRGFAGRFGSAPGGGVLLTGPDRVGRFHAPLETVVGAQPDWKSLFAY